MTLTTRFTVAGAASADSAIASLAICRTFRTRMGITAFASVGVIPIHGRPAVAALHAIPIGKERVGAIAVVRLQDLAHDQEEVEQPTFRQRILDGL